MRRYDCSKTRDFLHEAKRLCRTVHDCDCCPIGQEQCWVEEMSEETIEIVQQWSDDNIENPKITLAEQYFLEAIKNDVDIVITRIDDTRLRVTRGQDYSGVDLYGSMFPFIQKGDYWSVRVLLALEVE